MTRKYRVHIRRQDICPVSNILQPILDTSLPKSAKFATLGDNSPLDRADSETKSLYANQSQQQHVRCSQEMSIDHTGSLQLDHNGDLPTADEKEPRFLASSGVV